MSFLVSSKLWHFVKFVVICDGLVSARCVVIYVILMHTYSVPAFQELQGLQQFSNVTPRAAKLLQ